MDRGVKVMLLAAALMGGSTAAACVQGDAAVPCRDRTPAASDWKQLATPQDRERLRKWRDAWAEALTKVRAAGRERELAGYGPLLQPDLALAGAWPAAGDYACRVVKLGTRIPGGSDVVTYPPFRCRIDGNGDALRFTKLTGSQRPTGVIVRDDDTRAIFLGTLVLGDETVPHRYGQDAARDTAGIVQRVDARRWRIVLPYPAFESTLDVIELSSAR